MKMLAAKGGRIDAVFFCPHAPEQACDCRKPQPGMMFDIARRYGVDLKQVPMVADTLRDLQAAQAAGCPPHLIKTGRAAEVTEDERLQWVQSVPGTVVHDDLGAFARYLLQRDAAAKPAPSDAPGH
jgi:D-glycero-D-manno-heptose 1,7-bisphosphate phosphatase